MSSSQTLCLTRLGSRFQLSRHSARRVLPLQQQEEMLRADGAALVVLEGLPVLLVEPERLAESTTVPANESVVNASGTEGDDGVKDCLTHAVQRAARLAVVVNTPGDLLFAIAADQIGPMRDEWTARPIDVRKGLINGE